MTKNKKEHIKIQDAEYKLKTFDFIQYICFFIGIFILLSFIFNGKVISLFLMLIALVLVFPHLWEKIRIEYSFNVSSILRFIIGTIFLFMAVAFSF